MWRLDLLERLFDSRPGGSTKDPEHWYNGTAEPIGRSDLYLRINPAGPLWEIEARHAGQVSLTEYGSEVQARRILTHLLASGTWRRLPS